MLNQYKFLIISVVVALVSAPAYSAGYVSIGGVGNHGYGHITIGRGMYVHGNMQGHAYHISGGYYSPPVMTHSYSSHCYGAYCGGEVHYIRNAPSIDYFRGLSDATTGVNCIGCTPQGTYYVPAIVRPPTIVILPSTDLAEPEQTEYE